MGKSLYVRTDIGNEEWLVYVVTDWLLEAGEKTQSPCPHHAGDKPYVLCSCATSVGLVLSHGIS